MKYVVYVTILFASLISGVSMFLYTETGTVYAKEFIAAHDTLTKGGKVHSDDEYIIRIKECRLGDNFLCSTGSFDFSKDVYDKVEIGQPMHVNYRPSIWNYLFSGLLYACGFAFILISFGALVFLKEEREGCFISGLGFLIFFICLVSGSGLIYIMTPLLI